MMKMILGLLPASFEACLFEQADTDRISKTRKIVDRILIIAVDYFIKIKNSRWILDRI